MKGVINSNQFWTTGLNWDFQGQTRQMIDPSTAPAHSIPPGSDPWSLSPQTFDLFHALIFFLLPSPENLF